MDGLDAQTLRELLPSLAPTIELIAAHLALPPPVLYVHAPSSTALAPLLIRALAPSHELCVHLDCVELHEPRLIYDRALNGLAAWDVGYEERYGGVPNWDGREASARKRGRWDPEERPLNDTAKGAVGVHADESMSTFIAALQRVFTLDAEDTEPRPRFLIFDHTERLAHLHDGTIGAAIAAHINEGAFFAALSRLGEFTGRPIVPIFISHLEPSKLAPPMGKAREGPVVVVPELGKDDCVNMVMHGFAPPSDEDIGLSVKAATSLFRSLVELVYTSIESHIASERRVDELAAVSSRCRAAWVENVRKGLAEATDRGNMQSFVKQQLRDEQMARLATLNTLEPTVEEPAEAPASPSKKAKETEPVSALSTSLPVIAKLLLVASFLASHNPPRTDIRLFATVAEEGTPKKRKGGGTRKSPRKASKATAAAVQGKRIARLTGPSAFPVERMLAIYEGLVEHLSGERRRARLVEAEFDVGSQIATLLSLRLLLPTSAATLTAGGFDKLNGVKLKSNIQWDEAKALSGELGIVLDTFLNDPEL